MKTTNFYTKWIAPILYSAIATTLISCEKDLIEYQGKEGVYFAVQHGAWNGTENNWPFQPYSNVKFASVQGSDTTIRLKVRLIGPMYTYDRPFGVTIDPDSTTAELDKHYRAIPNQFVIPANSSEAFIPVTVIRTPDLKSNAKTIGLRLLASEQLALAFPEWDAIPGYTQSPDPIVQEFDASLHKVIIDDLLPKPEVWSGSVAANNLEAGNWGEYSEKKILLICEVMGLSYIDFGSRESMPTVLINLITREMAIYLQARYNAGEPVLEDDGRLMFIRGVSWTSYVGVPWKN